MRSDISFLARNSQKPRIYLIQKAAITTKFGILLLAVLIFLAHMQPGPVRIYLALSVEKCTILGMKLTTLDFIFMKDQNMHRQEDRDIRHKIRSALLRLNMKYWLFCVT